jgi:hypothetical protein
MPYNDEYGDGNDMAGSAVATPGSDTMEEHHDEGEEYGKTAVLPSELCPGMKAGEQIILRIVGVDKDSYEVAYEPEEKGEEGEMEGKVTAPQTSPGASEMSSMME